MGAGQALRDAPARLRGARLDLPDQARPIVMTGGVARSTDGLDDPGEAASATTGL